ncbi:MAG: restriction endonuclease subunit S [Bacteroidales bacterium]|nr:restriction endonuclease subunit S [Lachnoclostridium sp.]MCM1384031.1 restriction endonuclease subunit S [Lachnoclostridium sp.]MCM1465421.1 restriction endonuclease subunit S [Bacteroidales bacterium]
MVKKKKAPASFLLPADEQPYKVPDNWLWVALLNIAAIKTGKRDANYGIDNGKYFFFTCASEPIRCENYSFDCKAILLAGNGNINNISMYEGKFEAYQRTYVVEIKAPFLTEYFYYYFQYRWVDYNIDKMFGTAIPYIRLGNLQKFPVSIPPLSEQQRIVTRIESLFAKLDGAKEKAQGVVDGFELRKSAIMHKAFTGKLTEKWRKKNRISLDSWKEQTVGQICKEVKVGIVIKPSQYYTDEKRGTPAFRSANVRESHIDNFDWVYLDSVGMEQNKRSIVHTGDVLVVRSGNPGISCVVTEEFDGYNAIDILIAVPDQNQVTSQFLSAYTNSPFGKNLVTENKRGMALMHFNVKGYSNLPIKVPSLPEQEECIQTLAILLNKEQQAKEAAEAVLSQIDTMKKTILARAFCGKLGTNDLAEESSMELLKKMR